MTATLSSTWRAGTGNGTLRILLDLGEIKRQDVSRLCVMTQLFPLSQSAVCGAKLLRAEGSFHEFELPEPKGQRVSFELSDLAFAPRHFGEGPRSAYIETRDGSLVSIDVTPMERVPQDSEKELEAPTRAPLSGPLCIPWPNQVDLTGTVDQPRLNISDLGNLEKPLIQMASLIGLDPRSTFQNDGTKLVQVASRELGKEAYRIRFGTQQITMETGPNGEIPAIATLVQLMVGAQFNAVFPAPGSQINDAPAFGWRGFHLDCARHFFSVEEIERVLAIMAVLKLNCFHWHLTDDEAWRPEISTLPELAQIGGVRGPGRAIPSQFLDGPDGHVGSYSRADMLRVVESARQLGISVLPEIDLPGHSTALLKALPHLVDPGEPSDCYRSVQNFANNSLNPAVPAAMQVVEKIIAELTTIFPGPYFHLGGDELPKNAWANSPVAQKLAADNKLSSTDELQKVFFDQARDWLSASERRLAVWDEQGRMRSVDTDALVFCWQDPDVARQLTSDGYPVVICPAQACYLDIATSADWSAAGTGWAGVVTIRDSYEFDPLAGIAPQNTHLVAGVQACLWTELVPCYAEFERAVFPRLFAVAETAWTRPANKAFDRFQNLARPLEHAMRVARSSTKKRT